ncbi:hypothetical protein J437_LFUL005801 [Ladona fulva]|uniref:C2 domain-containing protein n=1 Tax=Ladona fulva TaxID=123851 RepID=A0A8K0K2I9_LADFU|nr:hypothetical protein J437_LFUL005801 [Ladona fulva]
MTLVESSLVHLIISNSSLFNFADPYVKVWLQFGEKRIEKRKTPIFKCTLNPIFNETFSFNVPWEKIRECSLDVMVMDFDNIGRNELIGRILLAGEDSSLEVFLECVILKGHWNM